MDSNLISKLYDLVDLIKDTKEYKNLKDIEKKMENDDTFIILSNSFVNTQNEYKRLDSLNLSLDKITKELSTVKEKLYNLEIVKEYNKAYEIVKEMLNKISSKLLEGVFNNEGK